MIEAPEIPHPPHRKQHEARGGHAWLDIALAVSLLCVSAGSLLVAIHTSHAMEKLVGENSKLVRAQSTPLLQYSTGNLNDEGDKELVFSVENVGSGPARVVWLELKYDGWAAPSMDALLRKVAKEDPVTSTLQTTSSTDISSPRTIPAGATVSLFHWKRPAEADPTLALWSAVDKARFSKMSVEACYCSVFDECWRSAMQGDTPTPVASCDPTGRVRLNGVAAPKGAAVDSTKS